MDPAFTLAPWSGSAAAARASHVARATPSEPVSAAVALRRHAHCAVPGGSTAGAHRKAFLVGSWAPGMATGLILGTGLRRRRRVAAGPSVRNAAPEVQAAALGVQGRLGAHALVWIGGLSEDEVHRAATGAKGAGYDMLEVPLLDPDSVDAEMIKRVTQEAGLAATSSLGLPFDADVSSEDPGIVAKGEERLEIALDLAAGFGAQHMCGILYSAFGKYSVPPTARGRENSIAAMRRLGEKGAQRRVQINLEVVNRYETNLLNTAEQAVAFCDEVGHPNVKIHLDTYHMNIEEPSFDAAVATCGSRLGYVHIGESHRGYLGTGTVAWPQFFGALQKAGYAGPLTFESFSNKVVAPYCVDALCVWRNLWEDSDDLARAANGFIRDTWQ